MNEFNVVYQKVISMYDSGCQICCEWSRIKPGFNVSEFQLCHESFSCVTRVSVVSLEFQLCHELPDHDYRGGSIIFVFKNEMSMSLTN